MTVSADTIIVGGGIIGCALFHELARSKTGKILLLERASIASATTGESGGYVRKVNPDPHIQRLSAGSYDYYQDFQAQTGGSCGFIRTGMRYRLPAPLTAGFTSQLEELLASGYELESVAAHGQVILHEHGAGCIDTVMTCRSWIESGIRHGGVCHEHTAVEEILVADARVRGVKTEQGMITAAHIVIAAGAWSPALLKTAGIDSPLHVESFQYNVYRPHERFQGPAYLDAVDNFYVFPFRDGTVAAGLLNDGILVCGGAFDHQPDLAEAQLVHARVSQAYPAIFPEALPEVRLSYDAFTDDGRGLMTSIPSVSGLTVVSGWSAGGIKTAPAVAMAVSQSTNGWQIYAKI